MPLNRPSNDSEPPIQQALSKGQGLLYVVATPIGNTEDITLRALDILATVDLVAAEDTRHTRRLLARHHIKASLVSYHEHNEKQRTPELIASLKKGMSIALVSNAGTPTVSDPGYSLIKTAVAHDIRISPVPGVSAVTTALSAAGLPTDSFVFIGFPARKKGKRLKQLEELAGQNRTIVFYASPRRLLQLLSEIVSVMGDRLAVVSREMTKLHEEFLRGFISDIIEALAARPEVKGECTLLIAGAGEETEVSRHTINRAIIEGLESPGSRLSEVVKMVSEDFAVPRKSVYAEALKIKSKMGGVGD